MAVLLHRLAIGTVVDAATLEGRGARDFLAVTGMAADSRRLGGKPASAYLGAEETAANSARLGGVIALSYLRVGDTASQLSSARRKAARRVPLSRRHRHRQRIGGWVGRIRHQPNQRCRQPLALVVATVVAPVDGLVGGDCRCRLPGTERDRCVERNTSRPAAGVALPPGSSRSSPGPTRLRSRRRPWALPCWSGEASRRCSARSALRTPDRSSRIHTPFTQPS